MPQEPWPAHPEIAIGIPYAVVTAKPAFKAKCAEACGYTGPLTLDEAVKKHRISTERAEHLVRTWEQAAHKQFAELPVPVVTHPAVKFSEEERVP
jgi:hypothetical protein